MRRLTEIQCSGADFREWPVPNILLLRYDIGQVFDFGLLAIQRWPPAVYYHMPSATRPTH